MQVTLIYGHPSYMLFSDTFPLITRGPLGPDKRPEP